MHLEVTVPEVFEVFKEICLSPEKLFEMMRLNLRELAGEYLTALMEWELTIHLGQKRGGNGMNAVSERTVIATAPILGKRRRLQRWLAWSVPWHLA